MEFQRLLQNFSGYLLIDNMNMLYSLNHKVGRDR